MPQVNWNTMKSTCKYGSKQAISFNSKQLRSTSMTCLNTLKLYHLEANSLTKRSKTIRLMWVKWRFLMSSELRYQALSWFSKTFCKEWLMSNWRSLFNFWSLRWTCYFASSTTYSTLSWLRMVNLCTIWMSFRQQRPFCSSRTSSKSKQANKKHR